MLSHAIFDRLGEIALILAPDSTVLDQTSATLVELASGQSLRLEHRRLAAIDRQTTTALRQRIVALGRGGALAPAVSLALPRRDGAHPALAILSAVAADPAGTNAILVHVVRHDLRVPAPPSDLRALFGLTATEAHVACTMLDVGGPEQVASRLGIRLSTVRTHLHRIFDKTGTTRQGELVRLLLAYSAPRQAGITPAGARSTTGSGDLSPGPRPSGPGDPQLD